MFKANPKKKEFEVEIKKINENGEGSADYSLETREIQLSLPYTLPGEKLSIISHDKSQISLNSSLIKIKSFSSDREINVCNHFTECGGCLLQHWNFKKYINWKFNLLSNPIIKMSPNTNIKKMKIVDKYSRRRCKIFVKKTKLNLFIGFKSYKSNQIVNINYCEILDPDIQSLIKQFYIPINKNLNVNEEMILHINRLDAGFDVMFEMKSDKYFRRFDDLSNFCNTNKIVRLTMKQKQNKIDILGIFDKTSLTLTAKQVFMLPPPGGFFQATKFAEKMLLDEVFFISKITKN